MPTIKKFQPNTIYSSSNSKNTYQLLERAGHYLVLLVRRPKDRTTFKITATSFYKADDTGAFEEILLMDGGRVRSNTPAKMAAA